MVKPKQSKKHTPTERTKIMKAILIARVSTEEQREAGNSLPAQIARLEVYCNRKSFEIIEICSFDESAYKDEREKFDLMVKATDGNQWRHIRGTLPTSLLAELRRTSRTFQWTKVRKHLDFVAPKNSPCKSAT